MKQPSLFCNLALVVVLTLSGCSQPPQTPETTASIIQEDLDLLQKENQKLREELEILKKEYEGMQIDLETTESSSENSMIETERKFLVEIEKLPADMESRANIYEIKQTYLNYSPEIRVRNINDRTYYFTLKRPKDDIGLSREETNFKISQEDYEELLTKQVGSTIYKTRYQFYEDDTHVFVDVYSGPLEGLAVVEVEFESVELADAFIPLDWFGQEVTSDKRYKNASLARDGMPQDEIPF